MKKPLLVIVRFLVGLTASVAAGALLYRWMTEGDNISQNTS